jgi:hypothetical protein
MIDHFHDVKNHRVRVVAESVNGVCSARAYIFRLGTDGEPEEQPKLIVEDLLGCTEDEGAVLILNRALGLC